MGYVQKYIVGVGMAAGIAMAGPAVAAPIAFASGAGVLWTSNNDVVCGAPGACVGSTVAITPHGAWQGNNPDGSSAVWASYDDTGVTGTLAPINQPDNGLLMSLAFSLNTVAGTDVKLKVWADDTAAIWFNGVLAQSGNPFGVLYYGSYEPDRERSNDVPEPTSLALMGLGLFGAASVARRRN